MKRILQIKIGKWPLEDYLKFLMGLGGLVIGGFGWHLTDEYSNWWLIMALGGVAMFGFALWWTAQKPGNAKETPDR